jgi:hypothetical protein
VRRYKDILKRSERKLQAMDTKFFISFEESEEGVNLEMKI